VIAGNESGGNLAFERSCATVVVSNKADLESRYTIPYGKAIAWFTEVPAVIQPEVLAGYESLLDDEERQRHRAFHFPEDRQLYLVAHALLRTSLSRHADIPPRDWRFELREHGRPEIAANQIGADRIRFNLSHTRGLAACVITRRCDIGIDAECLDRAVDADSIASRYFSPHETRQLATLPDGQRNRQFLEYWTLKEAYVKACGGGLSMPLNSFYFDRERSGQWRINLEPNDGEPAAWQFVCMRPTANHALSIAVRRQDQGEYKIDIRQTTPSCEELIN